MAQDAAGGEESTRIVARADGERAIAIGRDALGNVLVTGDGNDVRVTLIVADQRLLSSYGVSPPPGQPIENPYRGLDAFREADAAWFFGRAKLTRRMWVLFQTLQRGSDARILAVVGASGSGKSSLVRAGFLTELARQPMEGLESPKVLVLRPGPAPLRRLAEVLGHLDGTGAAIEDRLAARSDTGRFDALHRIAMALPDAGRSRLVLVIDQFEELYTECKDTAARTTFLENLALAVSAPDKLVSVILTLRNDFAGAVKAPTAFATAVRENRLIVQAMDRDELGEAISRPAHELGYPWPPALVENLVAQTEGRAGALPLLQFALKRLWPDHVAGRLAETGWSSRLIEDFLVQAADILFETAGATDAERAANQRSIRRAFLAMVQFGEGAADTRRVARLSDFVADGERAEHVAGVLAPFSAAEARLVTASEQEGEPTYELTHEALISSWDRLRAWLGNVPDKGESERIRAGLRLRRRLSTAAAEWKAGSGSLWRPPELELLTRYRGQADADLTTDEKAFADASAETWNDQLAGEQRAQRRWRYATVAGLILAVIASAGAAFGYYEQRIGKSRELAVASSSQLDVNPTLSLVLAHEAMKVAWTAEAVSALRRALQESRDTTVDHQSLVIHASFTPDGNRALTVAADGMIRQWDQGGVRLAVPLRHAREVLGSASFNRDGTRVVTVGGDVEREGFYKRSTVQVWDAGTGTLLASADQNGTVRSAVFSPDGTSVVFAGGNCTAILWTWEQNQQQILQSGCREEVPSNTRTDCRPGWQGRWRSVTEIFAVSFSPDGKRIVTGGGDCMIRIWNAETGQLDRLLAEHTAEVDTVVFSSDGKFMATASGLSGGGTDPVARLWNVSTWQNRELRTKDRVTGLAFSLDGRFVATAGSDGRPRVWEVGTGKLWTELRGHTQWVWSAAFNPTNSRLLVTTGSNDGTARVWDIGDSEDTGRELVVLRGHKDGVGLVAFPAHGDQVLTTGDDKTARLWRLDLGTPAPGKIAAPTYDKKIVSPDGRYSLTKENGAVTWRNLRTQRQLPLPTHAEMAAFSRDGKSFIIAEGDFAITRIWDSETGNAVSTLRGQAQSAEFDQTDTFVVTASSDGTVRVWDVATGQLIARFAGVGDSYVAASFGADNKSITAWRDDGQAKVYTCNACRSVNELLTLASERAKSRPLTPEERRRFLHEDTLGVWASFLSVLK